MYRVNLLNSAKKDLKRLDRKFQQKTVFTLHLLEKNPFLGDKMSGIFEGWYRVKIPPLRIVYTPDTKNKIVWIRAVGSRSKVYK